MRNLKKGLALVLVLAMAASTFVTGAFNDVAKDHTNATAVSVLNDLGVLTGKTETTFAPAATLTRAEAAAVIYRLLSGKTNADNFAGATTFTDVAANFWGAGFVNFCVSEEIIMGYPDKSFKPDAPVTYAEFTTMLVRAAGLEEKRTISKIDDNGNVVEATVVDTKYPSGYIAIAAKNGMNDDVNLMANDAADRGNVAQMAYNTLFNTVTSSGKTLADTVFKVKNAYGKLTGDTDGKPEGTFKDAKTGGNTVTFDGKKKFDIKNELIGLNVKIMYKEPTTGSKEIVSIVAMDNTSYEVAAKDVKVDLTTTPDEYTFKVNGKDKTFTIHATPTVILNGVTLTGATDPTAAATITAIANKERVPTTYTFISDNNDAVINTVKVDKAFYGEVTSLTTKSMTVKVGASNYLTLNLEKDITVATGVVKGSRVMVTGKIIKATGTETKATVSLVEKQTGFVSAKSGDNYTIGGTVYTAATGITPAVGKTIEFYVVDGFVVEAKSTTESGKYAFITDAKVDMGTGKVKAYLSDGTNGIFDVDSNSAVKVKDPTTLTVAGTPDIDVLLSANAMYTYSMTSAGKIKLEVLTVGGVDAAIKNVPVGTTADFDKNSKRIDNSYVVDSSIIYVVDGTKTTVLKGQLPGMNNAIGTYKYEAVTEVKNGTKQIKVAVIVGSFSGVNSATDIFGKVVGSASVESTFEDGTTKYRVKRTIAAGGDANKAYYTPWVESTSDTIYTTAFGAADGEIVKIELTANGEMNKIDAAASSDKVSGIVRSFVNNELTTGTKTSVSGTTITWANPVPLSTEKTRLASDVVVYQYTTKGATTDVDTITVADTGALVAATASNSVAYGVKVDCIKNSDGKITTIFVTVQDVLA